MSLSKYNKKRDFKATSEPKGIIQKSENKSVFVVQKHAASHLHYDFRLEMDGVLKSWAVPKGPSLNPEIKHLAVLVEDHPYSYKDFEGTIPQGNYGAGNVIVWDKGTYTSTENKVYKEDQELLLKGFNKGHLSFTLHGQKLKGDFSLVQLKGKQENAWLLIKKEDSFASSKDILKNEVSVLSGLTLEQLTAKNKEEVATNEEKLQVTNSNAQQDIIFQKPMLATLASKSFDDPDWLFEKKYDGYRTLALINDGEVGLYSRNQQTFTRDFQTITDDLKKIKHNVILDGEVVVEDENGKSDFQMLQNYTKTGKGELKYYVFDILNIDKHEVVNLTLLERKELLKMLLQKSKLSRTFYSEHTLENGSALFEESKKFDEEGIMAKKSSSTYQTGRRSSDWLKIKNHLQEEAIIIGITKPEDNRSYFGALLLAQYQNGILEFIGKCGSGFTEETLKALYKDLEPYFTKSSPVTQKIKVREEIQWIKPHFICTVKFSQWTNDRHLRHPVFLGIRKDKKLKNIIRENEIEVPDNEKTTIKGTKKEDASLNVTIGKHSLILTNLNKIYFPESGITKGEIIHYYSEVADFILPYLKDRPESLNRFPNGINASSFYQKDIDIEKVPTWLMTKNIDSESSEDGIDYLICNDKETLIYMTNLGCIDFNPWNSTINNLDKPDWMVIDIDPDNDNFDEVIETALTVKKILDTFEIEGYCKTSGASGLHVYVPLEGKYNYESVKIFAQIIASEVQSKLPNTTTLERSIKKRNHKIYIDYLQNRKGQTIAAPYSVRPKMGATVSTPLEWSEVNSKLRPSNFNIKNVLDRFEKKGDLWKPVLGTGVDLQKIIENYTS